MSFLLQSPPLFFSSFPLSPKTLTLKPLNPFPLGRRPRPITALCVSDHDLLASSPNLAGDGRGSSDQLPAVRTYETDLACLTLVGSVDFEQALTAAAADGGDTAEEHLASGMEIMVVETLFPASNDEHSTVSTRLFLPAKKVKEKAKKLRTSLNADILSSNEIASKNILAMTFRQVVLQTLWSYKLSLLCPGAERDMEHLARPREVLAHFTVSSSDKSILSDLAEVVCSCALESTEKFYLRKMGGLPSNGMFDWFQKSQRTSSVDSSICIYRLSQTELMKNARNSVEKFYLAKGESGFSQKNVNQSFLEPPNFSQLDKLGGPGFSKWAHEYVPAYRLQIDANTFKDAKLEGWQELSNNRWEVLLTHFQMVELLNILDMYYEDQYTLPGKRLSCRLTTQFPIISNKKNSLWKLLLVSIAGGCFLVFVGILSQIYRLNLLKARKVSDQSTILPLSESYTPHLKSLEAAEVEALCISVIQKIKDELGWSGDTLFQKSFGAWTGMLPSYLRNIPNSSSERESVADHSHVISHSPIELATSASVPSGADNLVMQMTAQDIASYQVVMSRDGKVVGFQPTSRVAVNHWASNPLAKLLYSGQKLSPGILEPSLKIPHPSEVAIIELLMSVNPESRFALARPVIEPSGSN